MMTNLPGRIGLAIAGVASALAALPAVASTAAAFAAESRAAATACAAASDLRRPVVRRALRFSDTVGVDAMLGTGTWRPAHMHGAAATMLCLYHRHDRRAETVEAPGWTVR